MSLCIHKYNFLFSFPVSYYCCFNKYLKDYPTLKTKAVPYPLMFALQTGEEVLKRDKKKKKKNIRHRSCESSALNQPFNIRFGSQSFVPFNRN